MLLDSETSHRIQKNVLPRFNVLIGSTTAPAESTRNSSVVESKINMRLARKVKQCPPSNTLLRSVSSVLDSCQQFVVL